MENPLIQQINISSGIYDKLNKAPKTVCMAGNKTIGSCVTGTTIEYGENFCKQGNGAGLSNSCYTGGVL